MIEETHEFIGFSHCLDCAKTAHQTLLAENEQLRKGRVPCKACNGRDDAAAENAMCYNCRNKPYAEIEALKEWKERLIDEAVISWTLSAENKDNPKKMLDDIINWNVQVALDPKVSKTARDWEEKIEMLKSLLSEARLHVNRQTDLGANLNERILKCLQ